MSRILIGRGILSAKKRKVKFGGEQMTLPDNFEEVKQDFQSGKMSVRKATELCGMRLSLVL